MGFNTSLLQGAAKFGGWWNLKSIHFILVNSMTFNFIRPAHGWRWIAKKCELANFKELDFGLDMCLILSLVKADYSIFSLNITFLILIIIVVSNLVRPPSWIGVENQAL